MCVCVCGLLSVADMQTSLGAAHRDLLHLHLDSQRAKREQTHTQDEKLLKNEKLNKIRKNKRNFYIILPKFPVNFLTDISD